MLKNIISLLWFYNPGSSVETVMAHITISRATFFRLIKTAKEQLKVEIAFKDNGYYVSEWGYIDPENF